jgi:uncharacterized membrane protein YdjX (TVP38/TMEM64 family)
MSTSAFFKHDIDYRGKAFPLRRAPPGCMGEQLAEHATSPSAGALLFLSETRARFVEKSDTCPCNAPGSRPCTITSPLLVALSCHSHQFMSHSREMKNAKNSVLKVLSLIGFPLFFIAIILVVVLNFHTLFDFFKNPESVQEFIKKTGFYGPLIFIGLQILQVVVFIIPGEVTQLAGGYLFGTWIGTLLSVIGIVIGSAINFFFGRLLGIPFVHALFKKEQIDKIMGIISTSKSQIITMLSIFGIFLIPGLPKDIVTYIAGLTPIRFWVFLLVSGVGRLPGILVSSVIGESAADRNWLAVIVISVIGIALFVIGYFFREPIFNFLKSKLSKKGDSDHEQEDKK